MLSLSRVRIRTLPHARRTPTRSCLVGIGWGAAVALAVMVPLTASLAALDSWSRVTTPSHGIPEVIGSPAAGCIGGAAMLPPEGRGYQVMRLSRHRNYGHPTLIHFIQTLGATLEDNHIGVMLVGDLGQPRGGPTASLHRSHQNGLDVDIWYWLPREAQERRFDANEVETLPAPSVLAPDGQSLDPTRWTAAQIAMVQSAASTEEVDRIFVNPIIKKSLCDQPQTRSWLHKVRPWWKHDDHMHVRLRCPPGNDQCVSQKPVPPGDGCGTELDWWLQAVGPHAPHPVAPPPPAPIVLPVACGAILRAH